MDARLLRTGIGTYVINLLATLQQRKNRFEIRAIAGQEDVVRVAPLCDHVTVVDAPIYSLTEQIKIPRAAGACDLLHVPHYNVPLLYRGRLVVSICDLVHIMDRTYRRTLTSRLYALPMLHIAARKAQHILTLSEYSKAHIIGHLGVPPSKVTVIHCGVGSQFRPWNRSEAFAQVSAALPVRRAFLLYVGNLKPHKNVITLIRAFALLRARRETPLQLLIIGDDARWKPALVRERSRLALDEHVIFCSYVSDSLLPLLYAAAEMLVLPSKLEGFGLPVIEAMACGTPVVCSRAASLPEVAGAAAEYFDPHCAEDLAGAIQRVLSSPERREELRRKGLQRARLFTWEECARKHAEIYSDILGLS